jgi:hypothetical protein
METQKVVRLRASGGVEAWTGVLFRASASIRTRVSQKIAIYEVKVINRQAGYQIEVD